MPNSPQAKDRFPPKKPKRDFVQAIRCRDCHRLRAHPSPARITCGCGSLRFVSTIPHEDEVPLAMKLYAKEIEDVLTAFPHKIREM